MCGIIGFVNYSNSEELTKKGLKVISSRGLDASGVTSFENITFGHNLHSIISFVNQPIVLGKNVLVINCEIYNWKELSKKYNVGANNDSEFVSKVFNKKSSKQITSIIGEFDGDFALAYYLEKENKIILARDIIGVKPVVYSFDSKNKTFAFASEKKALPFDSVHLNPRKILIFDVRKSKLKIIDQTINLVKIKKGTELISLSNHLTKSILKRVPNKEFAVLFSGGLDSTLICDLLKEHDKNFVSVFAYVSDLPEPKDLLPAKNTSRFLGTNLIEAKIKLNEFEKELPKIISLIESTDPIRVGVASTIYFATKKLSQTSPNTKVVFSGLGADELFAGYDRFKRSTNINKDCFSYLIKMYENDLYYQDIVTMYNKLELRVPFLDKELVSFALALDSKFKLNKEKEENKLILREFALSLGLPKEIAYRKKKAAQYGSNFDKALEFLAKKNNFSSKANYLNSLSISSKNSNKNIPIAALISTGKDSIYAMQLMQKQGYQIKCLITIDSKNKDSFMFHTPTIELAKLQAKAIGLPLIIVKTKGVKEKELIDLEKAIIGAKNKYKIEGIVSGAIFSNYQRERIEKICENTGIRSFAPLWQTDQKKYLTNLINSDFSVIITKIAAYGLNEKWVGRKIDANSIKELAILEEKYKINPAGEGGEYESLVLDTPFFSKKIDLMFDKKMENEFTGEIKIKKVKLIRK